LPFTLNCHPIFGHFCPDCKKVIAKREVLWRSTAAGSNQRRRRLYGMRFLGDGAKAFFLYDGEQAQRLRRWRF
jgi:hypothetical protein